MTRQPAQGQPSRVDIVIAAGLAVEALVELQSSWAFERVTIDDPAPVHYAVVLGMCGALAWRRVHPLVVAPLVLGLLVLEGAVSALPNTYGQALIAIVAAYAVGAHGRGPGVVVSAVATLGISYVLGLEDSEDPIGTAVTNLLVFTIVMGAGALVRRLRARADRMRQERDEAEARLAGIAREERDRIARELHDVVAHGMSVVVLQARGGRRWVVGDPDRSGAAFDDIERVASSCLEETRRIVGILRGPDGEVPLAPQPRIADLAGLVDVARSSGAEVDLTVDGDRRELSPALELAAYRIAQEGLTNCLKHAAGSAVRVALDFEPDAVLITVTDDGPGGAPRAGGHGLIGMRERVVLYGGELDAGPRPEGGFAVHARLPYDGVRR